MKSVSKLGITTFILFVITIVQFASPQSVKAACSGIVYVDAASVAASPTGCSWEQAYPTLQEALKNPTLASGNQIWVSKGTYYPDDGLAVPPVDIRDSTFQLTVFINGVKIYGGFDVAGGETAFNQRDPVANVTILNGDINGTSGNTSDNAYHVVKIDPQITSITVLDGFTITGGNTEGDGHFGGGIYAINASPTLANLVITNNLSPTGGGGGMFIGTDPGEPISSLSLTNVTFSNNVAERGGGLFNQNSNPVLNNIIFVGNSATNGAGGGMNSQTANAGDPPSNPVLTNVVFNANTATGGGGMINSNSHAVMTNVTFSGNAANRRGGGLLNENSNPELTNVTFYNNTSVDDIIYADPRGGGGMMNLNSDPVLNNVTFNSNDSVLVGGDAMRNVTGSNPDISNGIFWGDVDDEITSDGTSTVAIKDSVVQGGITGTNIITTDPKLGPLASNGGFTQTMALGLGSSAINAGGVSAGSVCATTDQRGVTRPQGDACDIGAYEFDGATTTLTVSPVTGTYGNSVSLTASLTSSGTGLDGKTVDFTLNGSSVGSAVTNPSGVATLNSVSLAGINAGVYPGGVGSGVGASFSAIADPDFKASSDTDTLTINQRQITVTAVTDTKPYDGSTDSAGVPVITSGSLATGDTATWTQSFDTPDVGTNKTLTPAGSVADGNNGDNYLVTLVPVSGVITPIEPIFGDVPTNHPYWQYIEILYANGYTGGCSTSPLLFCPDTVMDRAQSAVFMLRGNFGSGYVPVTPSHFFKDSWSRVRWAEGWAESMYLEKLTAGCKVKPLMFCPYDKLTNVQAAVFGLRLKYGMTYMPPPATGTVFADMTNLNFWGISWAEQAYLDGLIPSCGTDAATGKPKFCPDALVNRGFGAYIIVTAKNLTMP